MNVRIATIRSREANAPGTRQLLRKIASDSELVDHLLHKLTKAIFKELRAEKEYRRMTYFTLVDAFQGGRPTGHLYFQASRARPRFLVNAFSHAADYWSDEFVTSPPRRPPGMSPARLKSRSIIAAAVVAGAKLTVFARQSRVSRSWASREAHSPGTRQLLQTFASDPELIESLLHKATTRILNALRAEKQHRRAGQIIIRGPDHRIRLQAAKATLHLAERHAKFGLRLEAMRPLLGNAWQSITDALEAEKVVCRSPHVLIRRPDHGVRRKAAQLALQFFTKLTAHAALRYARPVEHARPTKAIQGATQSFPARCRRVQSLTRSRQHSFAPRFELPDERSS